MEQLSFDEQRSELLGSLDRPSPLVIGVEGGPCSGKTTLLQSLEAAAGDRPVVVLPEVASRRLEELKARGLELADLARYDRAAFLEFEALVLGDIIDGIESARDEWRGQPALIVTDRCDIGAYVSTQEYRQLLARLGRDQPPILELVDQLIYLPSVARENPADYQRLAVNNPARYETAEQAAATCAANLAAVGRHPELQVAWGGSFGDKIDHLVGRILSPEQEIELALDYYDDADLERRMKQAAVDGRFLSASRISQSYHRHDGVEFRLRRTTTESGEDIYSWTVKQGSGLERHERQRRLTAEQYGLLSGCRRIGRQLDKSRYEFLQPHDRQGRTLRKWTADRYELSGRPDWRVEIDLLADTSDEIDPWLRLIDDGLAAPAEQRARDLAENE